MSFDADRLRRWRIPDTEQHLTRRDIALYALSTGFGNDPLDRAALPFVDSAHLAMVASPSLALTLAYPGFWLAAPALEIDAARVLHVDQSIELFGALPVEGLIRGCTNILGVVDRGEGRGVLVKSERLLLRHDRLVARLVQTHLLRSEGRGVAEPGHAFVRPRRPDTSPDTRITFMLPANAALLYRLNGDLNPLHSDPDCAARAGFARPIMHGMGTFGFVTRHLLAEICGHDPRLLASIAMRFTAPAFPAEELELGIWKTGAFAVMAKDGRRVIEDGKLLLR